jgi:hypothetical protein
MIGRMTALSSARTRSEPPIADAMDRLPGASEYIAANAARLSRLVLDAPA